MAMIDPTTGWFEIVKVPMYDLNEVMGSIDEYIYKSSARVIQFFNKTWLIRYLHPQKIVFGNKYEFKGDFTPLIKYINTKPVLTIIKNPQVNTSLERVHQVILNMLVTKDLAKKVFNYIDTWGETLASISWPTRDSYQRTIQATSGHSVIGRDMIFNLTSVIDWRVITAGKKRQVDMHNVRGNDRQVTHDYAISNLVYVEMTGIYCKLDYNKKVTYIIT